ncbi:peptidoglycan-binding protein LysM [Moraxella nasibovis]|uniref:peptidoglycan-binding protein LysM n=1 Tax=Moraxella nasibovis TaxID=2904120 RepID=UPI0024105F8E|nr:peptidoglycan-binding protein LysM [Moraxella nasibovis]WFF38322.1 peptidoglycan-binding protein LysM [Moraxella nasibovis]
MGIFSFAKDIGDKIFNRNKKDAAPEAANTAAPAAEPTAQEIANLLLARIQAQNVQISGLSVNYNGDTDTVTLTGTAKTQADRERARLAVGNVQHVETVVDDIAVESQEPESRFYTVKSGDTLSKIAKEMYGNANDYMKIFDANKPMLSHPDKIYVGQVLRIPA